MNTQTNQLSQHIQQLEKLHFYNQNNNIFLIIFQRITKCQFNSRIKKSKCQRKEIEQCIDSLFIQKNYLIVEVFILDNPIQKINNYNSELSLSKLNELPLMDLSDFKMIEELTPLINYKNKHQLQIKQQSDQEQSQSLINSQLLDLQEKDQIVESQFQSNQTHLIFKLFQIIRLNNRIIVLLLLLIKIAHLLDKQLYINSNSKFNNKFSYQITIKAL
ncbi:unnamed protein product [Paramecium sonneborni]|uniref:Uncharacterized protein n=1 Tax=Paramecium sonneborni TaxID=65129 RepID=A0A8S1RQI9_9CILI|nr:unnamed protein product [Paramecium sonneborni]